MASDLMVPTVHLNGTAGDVLSDQCFTAARGIDLALGHLEEAAPNGRDYYPQGADAFARAMTEHKARVQKLTEVRDDLRRIMNGIENQLTARGRHGK